MIKTNEKLLEELNNLQATELIQIAKKQNQFSENIILLSLIHLTEIKEHWNWKLKIEI